MQMLFSPVYLPPSPSVSTDFYCFSASTQKGIRREMVMVNIEDDGCVVWNPLPTCCRVLQHILCLSCSHFTQHCHEHTFALAPNTLFCHCDRWFYTEAYENIKFFINLLKFGMPVSNLGSYAFNTDITESYLVPPYQFAICHRLF